MPWLRLSRVPLVLLAILSLTGAVFTGLFRIGAPVPAIFIGSSGFHSALMISGFFGTVIGLERAVATRMKWPYLSPLLSGIAGLSLLSTDLGIAPVLFTLAGFSFIATNIVVVLRQPAIYTMTLFIGAFLWLCSNLIWLLHDDLRASAIFGLSFLVLTIAAERLELTRFLPPRKYSRIVFIFITLLVIGGTAIAGFSRPEQNGWLGLGYGALAIWLFHFDIARKTILKRGVTRFVAICLLSGYVWLLVGGFLLADAVNVYGFQWDAAIHAIALGFVFSMVIGHAPIIFPAVIRLKIPFSALFYLPFTILQFGLLIRVCGDLSENAPLRMSGGIINGIAIATFLATLISQVIRGSRAGS